MSRIFCVLAATAVWAATASATPALDGVADVRQQGRGGGQQRDEAQGRGNQGRQEPRQNSARGERQGGRDEARPARQGGERGGQSGSARSSRRDQGSGQPQNRGSGSAREDRGSSSSASANRGRSGSSPAAARGDERGSASPSPSSGRRGGSAAGRADDERRPDRMRGSDLQARIAELPENQRRMANSRHASERMTAGAIARGRARGLPANAFDVRSDNGRVQVRNRRGDLLLDMDDRRAGELGGWRLRRLGDRAAAANAPAFCRNGAGHPVWGRDWCLDKGFGLGSRSGTLWSRGSVGDVVFRRRDTRDRLDRGGLAGVLGDVVFGRLALQAITLGYDQPLVGVWVAQPEGPRILQVRSGDYAVAEFVDRDRDDRVEVLYVVQPVW